MNRPDPHIANGQLSEAHAHLFRGIPGERDRQDLLGQHQRRPHPVGDPANDRTRLASPGPSENHQRSVGRSLEHLDLGGGQSSCEVSGSVSGHELEEARFGEVAVKEGLMRISVVGRLEVRVPTKDLEPEPLLAGPVISGDPSLVELCVPVREVQDLKASGGGAVALGPALEIH